MATAMTGAVLLATDLLYRRASVYIVVLATGARSSCSGSVWRECAG